jgi:hypothetical protein
MCGKKGKKPQAIYPVRIPADDDEYIGYKSILRIKYPDRQCVVQFLLFPHVEITSKTYALKYEVVVRSRLVPYHGGRETPQAEHDRWCPDLSEKYLTQLRRHYKCLGEVQLRTEELYLERVLEKAREERNDRICLEKYNVMAEEEEPQECKWVTQQQPEEEEDAKSIGDDSDRETTHGLRRSKRNWNQFDDTNNEWLHCGDIIRFYKPGFSAGDARFLCEATIKSIRPREDPSLVVDCEGEWYMDIPNYHPVMRIKRMERGKLVENEGGCYRPVENYVLKREGGAHAAKEVMERRVRRVKEITQRNKQVALEKIEREGCGPTDMFR